MFKLSRNHSLAIALFISALVLSTTFTNCSVPMATDADRAQDSSFNANSSGTGNAAGTGSGAPAAAKLNCTFNGGAVVHGASVTAYSSSTVPAGMNCAPETRTCDNGALSGSYGYASCAVNAPAACLHDGRTVASGTSVVAYSTRLVPYGAACAPETRACNNGVLSGSYAYANCDAEKRCGLPVNDLSSYGQLGGEVIDRNIMTHEGCQDFCVAQGRPGGCIFGIRGNRAYGGCMFFPGHTTLVSFPGSAASLCK